MTRTSHTAFFLFSAIFLFAGCGEPASVGGQRAEAISTTSGEPVRADWPAMGGPNGDHSTPEAGLSWDWPAEGPTKRWAQPCGSGYGMPIVADGKVFILAKEDGIATMTARNLSDGSEVWQWAGPEATYEDEYPDYSDGPYSTPSAFDGVVYLITGEGVLFALNAADGEPLRELDLLAKFDAPVGAFPWGTSPLLVEHEGSAVLVLNVGGGSECGMVCLNAETFDVLWSSTTEGRGYATPRIASVGDRSAAFTLTDKQAIAVDLESGDLIWSKTFGVKGDPKLRANAVSPLVVSQSPARVFFTAGPGAGLLEVTASGDGTVESEMYGSKGRRTLDSQFNNLTCDGERLYGFTSKWNRQAQLRCIDLTDGEVLWDYDSDLQRGGLVFVEGRLLATGEDGHLAVLRADASGPDVLAKTEQPVIDGPCYTAPVVAQGRLLLRTEREVVCFDLVDGLEDVVDTAVEPVVGTVSE